MCTVLDKLTEQADWTQSVLWQCAFGITGVNKVVDVLMRNIRLHPSRVLTEVLHL